jgi:hypothetical protein
VASLFGKWDDSMHYKINGDSRNANGSEPHLLWKRSKPSKHLTRYNLTRFAITLNELTPELKVGERFEYDKYLSLQEMPCLTAPLQ